MKMRIFAGVECVDMLECVPEQVRKAGGMSSCKTCFATEEEVDELQARR